MNLTANAARPNPQGSFHYGTIPITRTLVLANQAAKINGKLRYAVNGISHVDPETPLKLADWFNISGVFDFKTFRDKPNSYPVVLGASVVNTTLHDYIEIVFQNNETTMQSWHLDGSSFFAVGYALNITFFLLFLHFFSLQPNKSNLYCFIFSFLKFRYGGGEWTPAIRRKYNLNDALFRHTVQVIKKNEHRMRKDM